MAMIMSFSMVTFLAAVAVSMMTALMAIAVATAALVAFAMMTTPSFMAAVLSMTFAMSVAHAMTVAMAAARASSVAMVAAGAGTFAVMASRISSITVIAGTHAMAAVRSAPSRTMPAGAVSARASVGSWSAAVAVSERQTQCCGCDERERSDAPHQDHAIHDSTSSKEHSW